jgi:hypothetical protein
VIIRLSMYDNGMKTNGGSPYSRCLI